MPVGSTIAEPSINSLVDAMAFTEPASGSDLPKICISMRYLQDLTQETLNAIMLRNEPPILFQRTGSLCRLKKVDDTRVNIEIMDVDMTIGHMARSALFVNIEDDPVKPPHDVARDILSLESWEFPHLSGIVYVPVLRRDGSILATQGYDESSGLYYSPAACLEVPNIKAEPTKEDAIQAAQFLLTEVLGDFPYVDQSSRANALAALLTPIVRPAIDGCTPLFLFDKPAPGSGATLQAELVSLIVTGESAKLKKQSSSDEEMRKQITSWLVTGPQLIVIDNIDTKVCAASLSSALTCRYWDDRILGRSKQVSLPNIASWYATGNNLLLAGDMPRRSCLIRIDAKVPEPWKRETNGFKHSDIIRWVKDNRGEILANALTMARAWFVAGKPKGSARALGSFESWTGVLSGILEYANVQGLIENSLEMAARDSGTFEWNSFLAKWYEILGPKPILMRQLLEELWKDKALAEVMPEEVAEALRGGKTQAAGLRVGKALARKTDVTHANGLMLVKRTDAHAQQKTWAVERRQ